MVKTLPLYSVYSALPVVRNIFNHGLHGLEERENGLGKMHQLFGDEMDSLIEELNEGLVA